MWVLFHAPSPFLQVLQYFHLVPLYVTICFESSLGVQEGRSSVLVFSSGAGVFMGSFGLGLGGGGFLKWLIVRVSVSTFACSAITWLSGSSDFH